MQILIQPSVVSMQISILTPFTGGHGSSFGSLPLSKFQRKFSRPILAISRPDERPIRQGKPSTLSDLCVDLTASVAHGPCDPLLGCEPELHKVLDILGKNSNSLLVCDDGPSNEGDIQIAEGIASILNHDKDSAVQPHVPLSLQGKRLLSLDMVKCEIAMGRRGVLEELMLILVEDIKKEGDVILFVKDFHIFFQNRIALYVLKSAMRWQQFQCVVSTTMLGYVHFFLGDKTWSQAFDLVWIEERKNAGQKEEEKKRGEELDDHQTG